MGNPRPKTRERLGAGGCHEVEKIDLDDLTPEACAHLCDILGLDEDDDVMEMIFMSEEFSEAVDFQAIMDGDTCESILKLDILDDSLAQLDGDSDSNFTALILLPCNVALALS